jgi:asparagine synthase (glutamine-hydrolysing)
MSAFVLAIRWRGSAPGSSEIAPLLETLSRRSTTGATIHRGKAAAVGVQHSWTTPEDVGVEQPVACAVPEVELVFDGRIDNRAELLGTLGFTPWAPVSDPELAARAVDRWGLDAMKRIVGPAALVVVDHRHRRLTLCRDALGDRTVVYARVRDGVIVASEEQAILAHPEISTEIDESSVARFLAVRAPISGRTFFGAIREVPAGHSLEIDESGRRLSRHWQPEEIELDLRARDFEWSERLRHTLAAAVECRLRSTTPPAVLMSGGLDSTSVAAHAATLLGENHRLHTISWVFDELEAADERRFIEPMIERFDLDASLIVGDDLWPLRDGPSRTPSPSLPFEGIYRSLNRTAHEVALNKGTPILLTGEMGDQLFANVDCWLRDLLRQGRLGDSIRRSGGVFSRAGLAGLRPAAGRLLGLKRRRRKAPPWMTSHGAALLESGSGSIGTELPDRARRMVDPFSCFGLARDPATTASSAVEIRRPYRDRRLIELALEMPAHHLSAGGFNKWVLRQAGLGLLPEAVRLRRQYSTLLPLCARGFADRGRHTVRRLLGDETAGWRSFVSADWVDAHLAETFPEDSIRTIAVWHCITLDRWLGFRATIDGATSHSNIANVGYNLASENDYQKTA